MKKQNMKILALAGLYSGLCTISLLNPICAAESQKKLPKIVSLEQKEAENIEHHLMTEEELLLNLNSKTRDLYNGLTPEGKQLVLKVASSSCDGTNECKGLNACETPNNTCAGKGECKGKGKCAIADKNLAVKLVADKMAKKRQNLQQSTPNGKK